MKRVIKNFKTFKETLRKTGYITTNGHEWEEYVILYGLDGFWKTRKTNQRDAYQHYKANYERIDRMIPGTSFLKNPIVLGDELLVVPRSAADENGELYDLRHRENVWKQIEDQKEKFDAFYQDIFWDELSPHPDCFEGRMRLLLAHMEQEYNEQA